MEKLRSCPFCGYTNAGINYRETKFFGQRHDGTKKIQFRVYGYCKKCRSRGKPITVVVDDVYMPGWLKRFKDESFLKLRKHGTGGRTMPDNDLISRAALIRDIKQHVPMPNTQELYEVNLCIIDAPAVDAAPVVHGTWGRYYDEYHCTEYIVCSNCGAKYDSDIVFAYHNGEPRLELEGLEHCPHCGARMDGGELNDT